MTRARVLELLGEPVERSERQIEWCYGVTRSSDQGPDVFESWFSVSFDGSERVVGHTVVSEDFPPSRGVPADVEAVLRGCSTAAEVLAQLGEPDVRTDSETWTYGTLGRWKSRPGHDLNYAFFMLFSAGSVFITSDPLPGEELSPEPLPQRPKLLLPTPNITFGHFPRILDIRWQPVWGHHPMRYEVELEVGHAGDWEGRPAVWTTRKTHLVRHWCGANDGRVRVRGRNTAGVGPWTAWREFKFEV